MYRVPLEVSSLGKRYLAGSIPARGKVLYQTSSEKFTLLD
jgi:hypothetical protein